MSTTICMLMAITAYAQDAAANYFTNADEAMVYAEANDAKILMVFGGSDWCRPCIKLKKEILDQSDFQQKIEGELAILYLDFPAKKKNKLSKEQTNHNEALAEKYNLSGSFPKIILMNKDFKKVKEIDYDGQSIESFLKAVL